MNHGTGVFLPNLSLGLPGLLSRLNPARRGQFCRVNKVQLLNFSRNVWLARKAQYYPYFAEAGLVEADVGAACAGSASESKAARVTNTADTHKQAIIP